MAKRIGDLLSFLHFGAGLRARLEYPHQFRRAEDVSCLQFGADNML
jgi:hypothetical protein